MTCIHWYAEGLQTCIHWYIEGPQTYIHRYTGGVQTCTYWYTEGLQTCTYWYTEGLQTCIHWYTEGLQTCIHRYTEGLQTCTYWYTEGLQTCSCCSLLQTRAPHSSERDYWSLISTPCPQNNNNQEQHDESITDEQVWKQVIFPLTLHMVRSCHRLFNKRCWAAVYFPTRVATYLGGMSTLSSTCMTPLVAGTSPSTTRAWFTYVTPSETSSSTSHTKPASYISADCLHKYSGHWMLLGQVPLISNQDGKRLWARKSPDALSGVSSVYHAALVLT